MVLITAAITTQFKTPITVSPFFEGTALNFDIITADILPLRMPWEILSKTIIIIVLLTKIIRKQKIIVK